MKATALLLAACCLAATALPGIAAQATATLEGMNEVPNAVNTATKGDFNAMLNGDRMDWTLKVTAADQVTMGHIHYGDPKTEGPVVVYLVPVGVGSAASDSTSLPMLDPPESGDRMYEGSFTAADMGADLKGKTLQDLIAAFQANNAYVNVHDVQNPAGVARGQVMWSG